MTRNEMTNGQEVSYPTGGAAGLGALRRSDIEGLFKKHYAQMFRLAVTLLYDEAESKDVVSEVFANLLSGKVAVRADEAKAYLMASVRNRCMNVIEHKQVHERFARLLPLTTDELCSNTAEEQLQMEELMRYVKAALTPMEQRVVSLHFVEELTCQEVAERLGVSRQTVHSHLRQAVVKIRKYFNSQARGL